jgi:hypothetical protein
MCQRFSDFYLSWVGVSLRNAPKGVNSIPPGYVLPNPEHSWRTADKENSKIGEPREKFSNLLGYSEKLQEGLP